MLPLTQQMPRSQMERMLSHLLQTTLCAMHTVSSPLRNHVLEDKEE